MVLNQKRPPALSVRNSLKHMGNDIRNARLRRGLQMNVVAQRAGITRTTLSKIQKGDPGVSMGNYAMVIFALGFKTDWMSFASIENDIVGQMLDEKRLPKRIRHGKKT